MQFRNKHGVLEDHFWTRTVAAKLFLLERMQLFPLFSEDSASEKEHACLRVHRRATGTTTPLCTQPLSTTTAGLGYGWGKGAILVSRQIFLDGGTVITFKTYSDCHLWWITWSLHCVESETPEDTPSFLPHLPLPDICLDKCLLIAPEQKEMPPEPDQGTALSASPYYAPFAACIFTHLFAGYLPSLSETFNIPVCVREPFHFTSFYFHFTY